MKILLSHGHYDHCAGAGALKALTDAGIYMSREGYEFMKACPEETMDLDPDVHVQMFESNHLYSDEVPVVLGNAAIRIMLTPVHTPGDSWRMRRN